MNGGISKILGGGKKPSYGGTDGGDIGKKVRSSGVGESSVMSVSVLEGGQEKAGHQ